MDEHVLSELRGRYHIAKLALFNVRILNKFDTNAKDNSVVAKLIADEARKNGMDERPSLLNQTIFLQFAYTTLVWLWESAKKYRIDDALLTNFGEFATQNSLTFPESGQFSGERKVREWKDVIRLLRNAISHGKVEMAEHSFKLEDFDQRKESAPTSITMSWEELGRISEGVIFAMTPLIWPEISEKAEGVKVGCG